MGVHVPNNVFVFVLTVPVDTLALAGELSAWLNDGMKKTLKEMVQLLDITCSGNMIIALKRAEKEGSKGLKTWLSADCGKHG